MVTEWRSMKQPFSEESNNRTGWLLRPTIGNLHIDILCDWLPARGLLSELFNLYNQHDNPASFTITVCPPSRIPTPPRIGFRARYGWFYNAYWDLGESKNVLVTANRSPLRPLRPLIDYEMHRVHEDFGRIIHEQILTTYIQMTQAEQYTFVHGAAMVTPSGSGVIFGGHGGVGKTSIALEMGRRHDWAFLSDDLTLIDSQGNVFFNANRPKIYAYNVLGDPGLEALILKDRSRANSLHWRLKKRWPDRVRRSVLPTRLYERVETSAPLRYMLMIEREETPELTLRRVDGDAFVARTIEILRYELRKAAEPVESFLSATPAHRRKRLTWDPAIWTRTLTQSLTGTELLAVRVPQRMGAREYKERMSALLLSVIDG